MRSGARELGAVVRLISDEPIADSTEVALPWDTNVYDVRLPSRAHLSAPAHPKQGLGGRRADITDSYLSASREP